MLGFSIMLRMTESQLIRWFNKYRDECPYCDTRLDFQGGSNSYTCYPCCLGDDQTWILYTDDSDRVVSVDIVSYT